MHASYTMTLPKMKRILNAKLQECISAIVSANQDNTDPYREVIQNTVFNGIAAFIATLDDEFIQEELNK